MTCIHVKVNSMQIFMFLCEHYLCTGESFICIMQLNQLHTVTYKKIPF